MINRQSEKDRLATKEDWSKAENRIISWMVFNTILAGIIIAFFKFL